MRPRARDVRELIDASLYVVDERGVAEAILARRRVRATVAGADFAGQTPRLEVRSFRRDRGARSFRLPGAARLGRLQPH